MAEREGRMSVRPSILRQCRPEGSGQSNALRSPVRTRSSGVVEDLPHVQPQVLEYTLKK
jgi:hypothetical protein